MQKTEGLAGTATQRSPINRLSNARMSRVCMVCFNRDCPKKLETDLPHRATFYDFLYNYQFIFIWKRVHLPREGCLSPIYVKGEHAIIYIMFSFLRWLGEFTGSGENGTFAKCQIIFNCITRIKNPVPLALFLRQFGTNSVHGANHTDKPFYALSKKFIETPCVAAHRIRPADAKIP